MNRHGSKIKISGHVGGFQVLAILWQPAAIVKSGYVIGRAVMLVIQISTHPYFFLHTTPLIKCSLGLKFTNLVVHCLGWFSIWQAPQNERKLNNIVEISYYIKQ